MGDNYWTAPEDLTASWAGLRAPFESQAVDHGGHLVILSVVAEYGLPTAVMQPEYLKIEPARERPKRAKPVRASTWWAVIRRIRSVAPNHGRAMIRLFVSLDMKGAPIFWTCPQVSSLESPGNGR